ncbi:uncharacterized protein ACN63O_003684 [Diretmus argenteus]
MATLSDKSAQEISVLLDEYGIKHGPVVDTTRGLYEKKLREAMGKQKRTKPSPDKTFYREEEEEVTYVTYRTPSSNDVSGDRRPYMRARPEWEFEDEPYTYDSPSTYRNISYLKSPPMSASGGDTPKATKSSRLIPLWVQFLFFLSVAAFLYLVFSNMETTHSEPFKNIE